MSLRIRSYLLSVLLLNVFYSTVSSLYFHIGETEKKCFIEEIPDETMIIGECSGHAAGHRLMLTANSTTSTSLPIEQN